MTGAELLVIPLVGLVIPMLLLLAALIFDALYMAWIAYLWYEPAHATRPSGQAARTNDYHVAS